MYFTTKIKRRLEQKRKLELKLEALKRQESETKKIAVKEKLVHGRRRPEITGIGRARISKVLHRELMATQAGRIISLFGTAYALCRAVNRILPEGEKKWHPSTVYRWAYPKEVNRGTGGEIPTRKIKTVLRAARYEGILITIDDLYPNLFD
jgi:hypothetical protein